jgi:peptidoglycan/LPS O-acetylase OafA/YrhL
MRDSDFSLDMDYFSVVSDPMKLHNLNKLSIRNPWLDILRGIAIFAVVAVHVIANSNDVTYAITGGKYMSEFFENTLNYGVYGVELFFFLSGWLLVSIYGINKNQKFELGSYWKRRLARIMPLWILFIALGILEAKIIGKGPWLDARTSPEDGNSLVHTPLFIWILSLTFTLWLVDSLWNTVMPGGWSIQAEIAHYLAFPILRKYDKSSLFKIWAVAYLLFSIIEETKHLYLNIPFLGRLLEALFRLNFLSNSLFFILGIAAFSVYNNWKNGTGQSEFISSVKKNGVFIVIATLTTFFAPLTYGRTIDALGFILVSVIATSAIIHLKYMKKMFLILGKYSYFIYFCHFKVLTFMRYLLQDSTGRFKIDITPSTLVEPLLFLIFLVATLLVSVLLAIPSHKYFEKYFINLAHR